MGPVLASVAVELKGRANNILVDMLPSGKSIFFQFCVLIQLVVFVSKPSFFNLIISWCNRTFFSAVKASRCMRSSVTPNTVRKRRS